jgi:hypothetical protein
MTVSDMLPWFALLWGAGSLVAALAALTARTVFSMCLNLAAAMACAAVSVLALGHGAAALALAAAGVIWGPLLLLAVMLLTARSIKGASWRTRLLPLIAAGAFAASLLALPFGLDSGMQQPVASYDFAFWLLSLLMASGAACTALLGFGERGALQPAMPSE